MREKKSKKKWMLVLGAGIFILCAAVLGLFLRFYPSIRMGKELRALCSPILTTENQSMAAVFETDISGKTEKLDAQLYFLQQEEDKYLVLEKNEHSFYLTDGILFLENAKAYRLTDSNAQFSLPELEKMGLFHLYMLCEQLNITRSQTEEQLVYELTLSGAQAQELLADIMQEEMDLSKIEALGIRLYAQEDHLKSIELYGSGKIGSKEAVNVKIELSDFQILAEDAYSIPENILQAKAVTDKNELFSISGDFLRLMQAFAGLLEQDTVTGSVELSANCGILQFQNRYDLSRLQNGSTDLQNVEEIQAIPAAIAALCMEGEISCTQKEDAFVYELHLSETVMQTLAQSIAPEIVHQVVHFTDGLVTIIVENESISSIDIDISGTIQILFAKADAKLRAKFEFLC